MLKTLRQPKLWITAASLAFIAVALGQQSSQLRALTLAPHGWWWLSLGLGVTWLSILLNGLAWKVLLFWLGHLPEGLPLVPPEAITEAKTMVGALAGSITQCRIWNVTTDPIPFFPRH